MSVVAAPAVSNKCLIYLSRIATNVSEDDIRALAKECLASEDSIDVKKLVKKYVNLNELKFISFKVGVDPKQRENALSADTWPDGICFREFVDYRSERNNNAGFSKTPRLV